MGYRQHNSIIMFKTPGLAKIQLKIYLNISPAELGLTCQGTELQSKPFQSTGKYLHRRTSGTAATPVAGIAQHTPHPASALPAASAPQCSRRGTLTPLPHRQSAPHLAGGVPPAALHAVAVVPRGTPECGGHEGGVEVRPQGGGQGSGAAVARWFGGFAGCGREPTNLSSTCSGGLFHSSKKKANQLLGWTRLGWFMKTTKNPKSSCEIIYWLNFADKTHQTTQKYHF